MFYKEVLQRNINVTGISIVRHCRVFLITQAYEFVCNLNKISNVPTHSLTNKMK